MIKLKKMKLIPYLQRNKIQMKKNQNVMMIGVNLNKLKIK